MFAKRFHLLHQRLRGMSTLAIRIKIHEIQWRTPKNTFHIILNETSFFINSMYTITPARQWCLHSWEIYTFPEAVICHFTHIKSFVPGLKIFPASLVMLLASLQKKNPLSNKCTSSLQQNYHQPFGI